MKIINPREIATSCNNIVISFLCNNSSREFKFGKLKLCPSFVEEYRNVIPLQIYLEVPTGRIWKTLFSRLSYCIQDLEDLMSYYGVTPYHRFILKYAGGEIFEIQSGDLQSEYRYQVLSDEACKHMKLGVNVHSLSIGFHGNMHIVNLKRRNGTVYFDNNWYQFLKSASVVVGDICIFQRTQKHATYRIAVLSTKLIDCYDYFKALPNDIKHGWKWFKILNSKTSETGELEVPRLFSLRFGKEINENINTVNIKWGSVLGKVQHFNKLNFWFRKAYSEVVSFS
ncbi:hypothetical protein AG4045_003087 [Apium graveolens]|uniref:TF-B3 domain-containing protein n=1 Tax=Apium graveolens TaxID=4045 RepID=A0A6L5B9Y2_APIGR|nr:hypothetical protein AG4045_003087 [Apium graveolens]